MAEFSLIEKYCTGLGKAQPQTRLAVGDDAAILSVPEGQELLVSVDTMVEGVHFLPHPDPAHLAHKILAVNLSDIAAMGGTPKWATLALTLPLIDESWLANFTNSLDQLARRCDVELIGGDFTQGPLSLTLQIMGLVEQGRALTRKGARAGDSVYVSGVVGDAALALAALRGDVEVDAPVLAELRHALDCPEPQLELGQQLLGVATACIDISDGVLADLGHIANGSAVSMEVDLETLPLSDHYRDYLAADGSLLYAASGGDDYQLAFCVPCEQQPEIDKLRAGGAQISKIGRVINRGAQPLRVQHDGKVVDFSKSTGYQHFGITPDK